MTGKTRGRVLGTQSPSTRSLPRSCSAAPGSPGNTLISDFSVLSIEEILADSEEEDEEDEEERSQAKEHRRLARQRSQAWLKEGGEDEPLNFLDPKVAQRVLGKQEVAGT